MRMHLYGYVNCERGLYTALREMEVNNIVTDIEGLTTEFRRKLPRSRKKLRWNHELGQESGDRFTNVDCSR